MLGLILVVLAAQASCDIVLQALNSRTVFTSLLSSHLSSFHQARQNKTKIRFSNRNFGILLAFYIQIITVRIRVEISSNLFLYQEYPKSQLRLRATLFRANLQQVADCNKHQHYECAINQVNMGCIL